MRPKRKPDPELSLPPVLLPADLDLSTVPTFATPAWLKRCRLCLLSSVVAHFR